MSRLELGFEISKSQNLIQCNLIYLEPRLSRLTWHQKRLPHMCRKCGYMSSDELWALQALIWTKLIISDLSERCWPWSYCIGIVYRLSTINHVRNLGTSVIQTFRYGSNQLVDKWIQIIEVTLWEIWHRLAHNCYFYWQGASPLWRPPLRNEGRFDLYREVALCQGVV